MASHPAHLKSALLVCESLFGLIFLVLQQKMQQFLDVWGHTIWVEITSNQHPLTNLVILVTVEKTMSVIRSEGFWSLRFLKPSWQRQYLLFLLVLVFVFY